MMPLLKSVGLALVALAMPIFVMSASAAEPRLPQSGGDLAINGAAAKLPSELFAKKAEPEPIKVAGRRGARIGAAIVGGIVAGALIAGAARAHRSERHYYKHRYVNRCDRWLYKCDYGNRQACRKFYRYCD